MDQVKMNKKISRQLFSLKPTKVKDSAKKYTRKKKAWKSEDAQAFLLS